MADYTPDEIMTALRRADAAGDTQGAQRLAQLYRDRTNFNNVQSNAQTTAPTNPAESPTLAEQAGRSFSRAGRNLAEGAAGLADVVLNPVVTYANKGLEAAGVPENYRFGTAGQAVGMALDKAGLPAVEPQGAAERYASAIERGAGGAIGGMGIGGVLSRAASPLVSNIGTSLATKPGLQLASAATGASSAQAAKDAGLGTGAQIAAGIAGGLAPSIPSMAASGVQSAFRGGEAGRQQVEQNIADFAKAGTVPTVGQATQSPVLQGAESLLSKTPGATTVMRNAANRQGEEVSNRLSSLAEGLSPGADSGAAGEAIIRGVSGPGGFVDRFKAEAQRRYDALDQHVPSSMPIDISNTKQALADINAGIAAAPQTSALMQNPKLVQLERAIGTDTGGGTQLPYEAVKQIRTMIGDQLSDFQLTSDLPRSKLKQLYATLSDDMKTAAENAGPQARQAWQEANAFYKAGQERIDTLQRVIDKNGGPEAVFNAAMSGTKDGATTLNRVMSALEPAERKTVSAAVINRLGKSNPSAQNAAGDEFSMGTFLTNWNKLSPQARKTLFGGYGQDFADNMDSIARVASNVRTGSQYLANPSGTAPSLAQIGTITGLASAIFTGNFPTAAGILGGAGVTNLSARLMTNPNFVRFLAKRGEDSVNSLPATISALNVAAKEKKDPELKQAADVLKQAQGAQ